MVKIFDDFLARNILTEEEIQTMSAHLKKGISFFNPTFIGTEEEALRWIVDNQLSPTPLGRGAFTENALYRASRFGVQQYLMIASGYDTFAYRQPEWASKMQIFELDHPDMICDKKNRVASFNEELPHNLTYCPIDFEKENLAELLVQLDTFDPAQISFFSLLGIVYYLPKEVFRNLLEQIHRVAPEGSTIVFDYNDALAYTPEGGDRAQKQAAMAETAGETMKASYSYEDLEKILSECGFMIYEHLTPLEITTQYFESYNKDNPYHPMRAFDNVNYCFAVIKSY